LRIDGHPGGVIALQIGRMGHHQINRDQQSQQSLVLTFPPFDQAHYLEAVQHILGRELDEDLRKSALQFAMDGRGFSGRTARHFANQNL
ncbi:MAG: hypothetical protein C4331_18640, partial [Meiothermus sp.]